MAWPKPMWNRQIVRSIYAIRGVEVDDQRPLLCAAIPRARYAELHEQLYGYRREGRPLEIVAARVEVVGTMPEPPDPVVEPVPRRLRSMTTETWFEGRPQATPVFLRGDPSGRRFDGPAILCEPTSTLVVDPGFPASTVLSRGEILIAGGNDGDRSRHLDRGGPRAA